MGIVEYFKKNEKVIVTLLLLVVVFVALRIPGVNLPYHQDESKAAVATIAGSTDAANLFAHPPLTALFFRFGNFVFGNEHLRLLPILFSVLSCFIFFVVMRRRYGNSAALWTVLFFTITFYSVLGSLMVDTDGAIIPFFFLLSLFFYDTWRSAFGKRKYVLFLLLVLSIITGFLVKLSFVLILGTFAADFILENRAKISRREIWYGFLFFVGFAALSILTFLIMRFLYPEFRIDGMVSHALYFFHLSDRNYTQVIVQGLKAVYYLSPLLLAPLFFISNETIKRTRIFFIYLILGFVFYFILFDFSRGALDKYLMFTIIPLAAIAGVIVSGILQEQSPVRKKILGMSLLLGLTLSILLFFLNFFAHVIPPLYPKDEWFGRVFHLKWNMLNPFNGGSGPLGFYISFVFIALSFITAGTLGVIGRIKRDWRRGITIALFMVGLLYNGIFIEELLFGNINGSAPKVLSQSISFIKASDDISKVITYNDSGAYELSQIGKYAGRFYAVPELEVAHKERFAQHIKENGGYFLVVDIPPINKKSFYGVFFESCDEIFSSKDQRITGHVYHCNNI